MRAPGRRPAGSHRRRADAPGRLPPGLARPTGRKGADGKPCEFHLYSTKQAIEEGYILDVLKGYQSYDTALKIAGKAESGDGGEVEEATARKGLMRWVQLHPTNVSQKVQIIVEHFHVNVAYLLEGKAKAMVVTDSRKSAVKYKLAVEHSLNNRHGCCAPWVVEAVGSDPAGGPTSLIRCRCLTCSGPCPQPLSRERSPGLTRRHLAC